MNTKSLWLRSTILLLISICLTPLVHSQDAADTTPLEPTVEVAAENGSRP